MGVSAAAEVTLGAITQYFPEELIERILNDTSRQSVRKRRLPAPMMMYYIIALGLYMSEGCRSVLRRVARSRRRWLDDLDEICSESVRNRLGSDPKNEKLGTRNRCLKRQILHISGLTPIDFGSDPN